MSDDIEDLSDIAECRIGNYIVLGVLGRGSFAEVVSARHILTGKDVAIKVIPKGNTEEESEADILKILNHPHITKLFEIIKTDESVCLVMENVGKGHLYDYVINNNRMTEAEARAMFRQLTSAVQYCHQRGIVHRDLKPENILLDEDRNIKLADFGLSTKFSDENITTFCGTMAYMAPEAVRFQPYYGPTVDVWSLGVILYFMVTRKMPFPGQCYFEMRRLIISGEFLLPSFLSEECGTVLKKLLTVNSEERPTLEEIMKDPWVNKDVEEELRPYIEPPWGDLDPQVTEKMKILGFDPQEIQDSLIQKKLNNTMGTYMILVTTETRMKGRKIRVRPCPSPDPQCSATSSQEVVPSGPDYQDPAYQPASAEAKLPTLPPSEEAKNNTPSASSEAGPSTPPLGPESTSATPHPALQHGPGDAHTTHSSSSCTSSGGAEEKVTRGNCLQAGHLDAGVQASSPGHSPGWKGLGRRAIKFLLKCTCFRPSTKNHLKRNKVKPV